MYINKFLYVIYYNQTMVYYQFIVGLLQMYSRTSVIAGPFIKEDGVWLNEQYVIFVLIMSIYFYTLNNSICVLINFQIKVSKLKQYE